MVWKRTPRTLRATFAALTWVGLASVASASESITEDYVLLATDLGPDSNFGSQVELTSSNLFVAAIGSNGSYEVRPGYHQIYVFARSGPLGEEFTEVARLVPDPAVPPSAYGQSLLAHDDFVVVEGAGRLWVYRLPLKGWNGVIAPSARILPADFPEDESRRWGFGAALSFSEELGLLAIGAPYFLPDGESAQIPRGAVYVLPVSTLLAANETILAGCKLVSSRPQDENGSMGTAIAFSGNRIFAGAPGVRNNADTFFFDPPEGGWSTCDGVRNETGRVRTELPSSRFGDALGVTEDALIVADPARHLAQAFLLSDIADGLNELTANWISLGTVAQSAFYGMELQGQDLWSAAPYSSLSEVGQGSVLLLQSQSGGWASDPFEFQIAHRFISSRPTEN